MASDGGLGLRSLGSNTSPPSLPRLLLSQWPQGAGWRIQPGRIHQRRQAWATASSNGRRAWDMSAVAKEWRAAGLGFDFWDFYFFL
jgi:hypothetical protein